MLTQWEYHVQRLTGKEDRDAIDIAHVLDVLGADGWKLAAVSREESHLDLYLKREKAGDSWWASSVTLEKAEGVEYDGTDLANEIQAAVTAG